MCSTRICSGVHTQTLIDMFQNGTESADLCGFVFELCTLTELRTFSLGAGKPQVRR